MSESKRIEGVLLSEKDYENLLYQASSLEQIQQQIDMLLFERREQSEQLDYWLSPEGGYQQKLKQQDKEEQEWLNRVRQNPLLAWRVRDR